MPYQFTIQAPSKTEAQLQLRTKLEELTSTRPAYAGLRNQVNLAAAAFIALLDEDPAKDVSVTITGEFTRSQSKVQAASISVSAELVAR